MIKRNATRFAFGRLLRPLTFAPWFMLAIMWVSPSAQDYFGVASVAPTNHLTITELSFDNGYVNWQVTPTLGGIRPAVWKVSVYSLAGEDLAFVCDGPTRDRPNTGNYQGKLVRFDLGDWIGNPDCLQKLTIGNQYRLTVSMEYRGNDGVAYVVPGTLDFTWTGILP